MKIKHNKLQKLTTKLKSDIAINAKKEFTDKSLNTNKKIVPIGLIQSQKFKKIQLFL